jgi:hypothetical protein
VARLSIRSISPKLMRSEFLILPGSGNVINRPKEALKSAAPKRKRANPIAGRDAKGSMLR